MELGGQDEPPASPPRLRGRLHQAALFVAVPAVSALIILARPGKARFVSGVYGATLVGLYCTSTLYNRSLGTSRLRPWMRWLDHAMIYVLIAGSYTPMLVLVAPKPWGVVALWAVWAAAALGVLVKCTRLRVFRRLAGAWYVVMGWACVLALPMLVPRLAPKAVALLAGGGVLYTLGAVVLYLRRPDPRPTVFGYHEIWHTFVVAASACHFALSWMLVRT